MDDESLERTLADIELLQAAYPDEVDFDASPTTATSFPLHVTLRLDPEEENDNIIVLEFIEGYPTTSGVQIASYRSSNNKLRMDAATRALRQAADESLSDEMEGGFACCAAAMEMWTDHAAIDDAAEQQEQNEAERRKQEAIAKLELSRSCYEWISGEPLVDRNSTFIAHLCYVSSEHEVKEALYQLISSSTKIQRASHNMYAWRLTEELPDGTSVKKHDNDDDGEDAAGSRMAQLLHMRGDDGVLVVVSRWFGGVHLGPKRFAHITNVARDLLVSVASESSSSSRLHNGGRAVSAHSGSTTPKANNSKI
jgi:hypothetical protein